MIQANELRVGNIVSDFGGREARVSAITERGTIKLSSEHYTDESFNLNERVINPIPLTEEWMLRFGFESNPYQDRYENKVIHIECKKTQGFTELWIEGKPHIKYVHQLQNLYFALTGNELKQKEG